VEVCCYCEHGYLCVGLWLKTYSVVMYTFVFVFFKTFFLCEKCCY
jgi:hypothetical protein